MRKLIFLGLLLFAGIALIIMASSRTTNKTAFTQSSRANTTTQVTLSVNAAQTVGVFNRNMLGIGFGNWEHAAYWNKPLLGDPRLQPVINAYKKFSPGYLRYAGGNWANDACFDRQPQWNANEDRQFNGHKCGHNYGTDELESLNKAADELGADVMIQVNMTEYDPAMWADMVKYVNIEKKFGFKYWEFGNENEASWNGDAYIAPDEYIKRAIDYEKAMKAVDPTIVIVGMGAATPNQNTDPPGPETAKPHLLTREMTELPSKLKAANGRELGAVSWHWYISWQDEQMRKLFRYAVPGHSATELTENERGRIWPDIAARKIEQEVLKGSSTMQGITEINTLADNRSFIQENHVAALFLSDALPRFAANGVDFASLWLGYSRDDSAFGMVEHSAEAVNMKLRSTYYIYYMLANYFGDSLVQSATTDVERLTIWASRDSDDPGKIKLLISNFSDTDITAGVSLQNFAPQSATYYELLPDGTLGNLDAGGNVDVYSRLNGVKLDIYNLDSTIAQIQPKTLPVTSTGFSRTFPRYSVTSVILSGTGSNVTIPPSATPTTSVASPTGNALSPTSITPTPTSNPNITITTGPSPTAGASATLAPTSQVSPTGPVATVTTGPSPTPVPTNNPVTCSRKPEGDADCDGKVNLVDLEYWTRSFVTGVYSPKPDFDSNGSVNLADLERWTRTFVGR